MTRGREADPILFLALSLISAAAVALMVRHGTLDHPGERSSHSRPTRKGGGVGIVLATGVGAAWLAIIRGVTPADLALVIAGTGLAAFSYLDDLRDRGFGLKLVVQAAAAAVVLAVAGPPGAVALPGLSVALPWLLALGGGLAWILFVTNAVNFLDGLNGLASGTVGIGLLAVAGLGGAPIALAVAAGIVGFLPFNFPAARIFMGDVGSQFLGFMAACLALRALPDMALGPVLPCALAPLLLDAAFTLCRRAIDGRRLTQAHRGHLYQVAHRAGMPASFVTLAYWLMGWVGALSGWAAAQGVPLAIAAWGVVMPFLAWAVLVAAVASRRRIGAWG